MGFHHPSGKILSGIDLEKGGTWLGLSTSGRFAMITNYRDPALIKPDALSRGNLVMDYLAGEMEAEEYLRQISLAAKNYNGFNFILGNLDNNPKLWYFSNISDETVKIPEGINGISNAFLNTPWPKMLRFKQAMQTAITGADISSQSLLKTLLDQQKAPENELPQTGIPLELEKVISSIFIETPNYGTVCSTVILIQHDGKAEIAEYVHQPQKTESHFTLNL